MSTTVYPKVPKMTATQATTFQSESLSSVLQINEAISQRASEGIHGSCECEAYTDTFTFNRWKAQGFSVKKGEKALRIATFVPISSKQSDSEEENTRLRPCTVFLFCRCQVEPSKERTHDKDKKH